MIERRVLKEKEKKGERKMGGQDGRRSSEGKGDGRRGRGGGGTQSSFHFKKSHFLQSQIIVFIKVKKKKKR